MLKPPIGTNRPIGGLSYYRSTKQYVLPPICSHQCSYVVGSLAFLYIQTFLYII